MRIQFDFGWSGPIVEGETRTETHWIYQLSATGETCPEDLSVFYVGVTNNPLARAFEHAYCPHSGPLRAIMEIARRNDWEIKMEILSGNKDREKMELLEKETIKNRAEEGYQLMNMDVLQAPITLWIEDQMMVMQAATAADRKVVKIVADESPETKTAEQ